MRKLFIFLIILLLNQFFISLSFDIFPDWYSQDLIIGRKIDSADFNNDNYIDLIVLDGGLYPINSYTYLKIFINYKGNFEQTPSWISDNNQKINSFAVGDYNNDNYPDIAVQELRNKLILYQNNNFSFHIDQVIKLKDRANFLSAFDERTIKFADVNNDNWLDIVFMLDYQIAILYNDNGNFSLSNTYFLNCEQWGKGFANSIDLGDFDNDGDLDLAISFITSPLGGKPGVYIYENINGTFSCPSIWSTSLYGQVAWVNLNNDDFVDLAIDSYVFANLKGEISSKITSGHRGPYAFYCDFDNDNYDEIINALNGKNTIFDNKKGSIDAKPIWYSYESYRTGSITCADFNNDQLQDFACANFNSYLIYQPCPITLHINKGKISPSGPPQIIAFGYFPITYKNKINLYIYAIIEDPRGIKDIKSVELLYENIHTNLFLNNINNSNVFLLSLDISKNHTISNLLLKLEIKDYENFTVYGGSSYYVHNNYFNF